MMIEVASASAFYFGTLAIWGNASPNRPPSACGEWGGAKKIALAKLANSGNSSQNTHFGRFQARHWIPEFEAVRCVIESTKLNQTLFCVIDCGAQQKQLRCGGHFKKKQKKTRNEKKKNEKKTEKNEKKRKNKREKKEHDVKA
jgi:hypothetical protein